MPLSVGVGVVLLLSGLNSAAAVPPTPPTVAITSPIDGSVAINTNDLILTVTSDDADGTVERVELFRDGRLAARATTRPYLFALVQPAEGTNVFRAVATDNSGLSSTSAPVTLFIEAPLPPYFPPTATLTGVASNTVLIAPAEVTLTAAGVAYRDNLRHLRFEAVISAYGPEPVVLAERSLNPSTATFRHLSPGTYSFRAVARDIYGNEAVSAPIPVTVLAPPGGPPHYRFTDLGALRTNGESEALGVNSAGAVAGTATSAADGGTLNAFLWQAGVFRVFTNGVGFNYGTAVNDAGDLLGYGLVGGNAGAPFIWSPSTGFTSLPFQEGRGLNNRGQAVGWRRGPDPERPIPVRWSPPGVAGTSAVLESLPQGFGGEANAINQAGDVAGFRQPDAYSRRATLWRGTVPVDLGILEELGGTQSEARGLNDFGQVVGLVRLAPPAVNGFVWRNGVMDLLVPPPGLYGWANAINNSGQGVGRAFSEGISPPLNRAVLWQDGIPYVLNSLATNRGDAVLIEATAINDAGQIAGICVTGGRRHAFLLAPAAWEPPSPLPTVSWVLPSASTTLSVGTPVRIQAEASVSTGTVSRVEFLVGNVVVATATQPPYEANWTPRTSGTLCLRALAFSASGQATATEPICLEVQEQPPRYLLTELGDVGNREAFGTGLNSDGHFVGQMRTDSGDRVAYRFADGILTVLQGTGRPTTSARAINAAGQVVVDTPESRAGLYQDGVIRSLGTLPAGSPRSAGRDLNASGHVVGTSDTDQGETHAVVFRDGTVVDIGESLGVFSQANAINSHGTALGWYQREFGQPVRLFLHDPALGLVEVPSELAGPGFQGNDLNDSGAIVGTTTDGNGVVRSFLWRNGLFSLLGDLGGPPTLAVALNNSNQVVGTSRNLNGNPRAFLFEPSGMIELGTLLPTGSRPILTGAVGINDRGQILANGYRSEADTTPRVFLLNPAASNAALNQAPEVAVRMAASAAAPLVGDDIEIQAAATDVDGTVVRVSFFAGSRALGTKAAPPYTTTWRDVPSGSHNLTAVAVDNFGASRTSAPVALLVRGLDPTLPAVAVIGAAPSNHVEDIRRKLRSTERFSRVDVIPSSSTNPIPTAAQLSPYASVVVFSFGTTAIPSGLGDVLADHVDSGRGVVLGLNAADSSAARLTGRFEGAGYLPWSNVRLSSSGTLGMVPARTNHPILAGVARFGGANLYFAESPILAPGSVRVASWGAGIPFLTTREVGGGRVVGWNCSPVSDAAFFGGWDSASDGARLLANALTWAGEGSGTNPVSRLVLSVAGTNNGAFRPREPIVLTAVGAGLPAGRTIGFYAGGTNLAVAPAPTASFTWTNAPIGRHRLTAVYTNDAGGTLASAGIQVTVDSRLSVTLLTPTNGTVVYLPSDLPMSVAVTSADAPVARVEYYLDGTQKLGTATNAPFSFTFIRFGTGIFRISAVVTDQLGARAVSATNVVTVVDPSSSVATEWRVTTGDWMQPTNWTRAMPRPQDRALINRGTATLSQGAAFATNLTVGRSTTASLLQTNGTLNIGGDIFLGESAGSVGNYRLDGPTQVRAKQLFVGLLGRGAVVQNGGELRVEGLVVGGDAVAGSTYDFLGGLIESRNLNVGGNGGCLFRQSGGTLRNAGGISFGRISDRTNQYLLSGGIVETLVETIEDRSTPPYTRAVLRQTGGSHRVTNEWRLLSGRVDLMGGSLVVGELETSSHLNLLARKNGHVLDVLGTAALGGFLSVEIPADYEPLGGDVLTLMTYGRSRGAFSAVRLPPSRNGEVWELEYRPNALVMRALPPPQVVLVGSFAADPQTNLFHQVVTLSNLGDQPMRGSRIYFPGLPEGWEVYNAAGVEEGIPYVEVDALIPPRSSVRFEVQFLIPGETRPARQNFVLQLDGVARAGAPEPARRLAIPEIQPDGSLSLTLSTRRNRRYAVEYSEDLVRWTRVPQPISTIGTKTVWIDDGEPKTSPPPSTRPTRYYRTRELP
jgi:probable HAF family extracellular repeat protein